MNTETNSKTAKLQIRLNRNDIQTFSKISDKVGKGKSRLIRAFIKAYSEDYVIRKYIDEVESEDFKPITEQEGKALLKESRDVA